MRRRFAKLPSSSFSSVSFTSSFSTSAGRGRGRGLIAPNFNFIEEDDSQNPPPSSAENNSPPLGFGHGHAGRGKPFPSPPTSISSFVANPAPGRGHPGNSNESNSIYSILIGGAGRGKVSNPSPPSLGASDKPKEENRHIRARPPQVRRENVGDAQSQPRQQRLSQEDAVKNAVGILSRNGDGGAAARGGRGEAFRGETWRGRGGRDGRRGRGRPERGGDNQADDDYRTGPYRGTNSHGTKLAQRLGPDLNNQSVDDFEEMSNRGLPNPVDDAYEEALRMNLMIECEPEYLMGDFASNPDIDERPPMPFRVALEKMKPFIMAYENIQSHQEWEV